MPTPRRRCSPTPARPDLPRGCRYPLDGYGRKHAPNWDRRGRSRVWHGGESRRHRCSAVGRADRCELRRPSPGTQPRALRHCRGSSRYRVRGRHDRAPGGRARRRGGDPHRRAPADRLCRRPRRQRVLRDPRRHSEAPRRHAGPGGLRARRRRPARPSSSSPSRWRAPPPARSSPVNRLPTRRSTSSCRPARSAAPRTASSIAPGSRAP